MIFAEIIRDILRKIPKEKVSSQIGEMGTREFEALKASQAEPTVDSFDIFPDLIKKLNSLGEKKKRFFYMREHEIMYIFFAVLHVGWRDGEFRKFSLKEKKQIEKRAILLLDELISFRSNESTEELPETQLVWAQQEVEEETWPTRPDHFSTQLSQKVSVPPTPEGVISQRRFDEAIVFKPLRLDSDQAVQNE